MGEVIEFNIVCRQKIQLEYLMQFILPQENNCKTNRSIEVMDNWCYENLVEVSSYNDIDKYTDEKIIQITTTNDDGQSGISIECISGVYSYCVWFNMKHDLADSEYTELIDSFIKYISDAGIVDSIIIGAIGKEVVFNYSSDLLTSLESAHGIDVWILNKSEWIDDLLECYKLLEEQEYKTLSEQYYILSKVHEEI